MAERVGFEPTCPLRDKTLSRRPRYDHFGTSPFMTTLGPSLNYVRPSLANPKFNRQSSMAIANRQLNRHSAIGTLQFVQRFSAKNACINSRQSASSTRLVTSIRWFSAG